MRLSEAIRLGAMLRPQGFGYRAGLGATGKTCAMGAVYEAIGILGSPCFEVVKEEFPEFMGVRNSPCPACSEFRHAHHRSTIVHLNDDHRWTREQIADWVETIESARQQATEAATSDDAVRLSVEEPVAATRA